MLFAKWWPVAVVATTGVGLAAGNLWFTAARSTIPLALDADVVKREVRAEKHPGVDDVHLLHFTDGTLRQVDQPVYAVASHGARLQKTAGSRRLHIDGNGQDLIWSRDFVGMTRAMPLAIVLLAILTWKTNDRVPR